MLRLVQRPDWRNQTTVSTVLGANPTTATKDLEVFQNPNPERDYTIEISSPEFTCLCPVTGQPDFAEITLRYIPDRLCVELKSYKLYLWSFREEGAFHEAVTNQILDEVVGKIAPREATVTGKFNVRGGLYTTVTATHTAPGRE
jgi:7-cyano-7-deazaguanine reductase